MVPRALSEGRSREEIIADLVRLDWSPAAAGALVDRIANDLKRFHESPERRQELVTEARQQMIGGLLMILLGLGGTAFTLLGALAGALPVAIVFYGLIVVGLILSGRGYSRWRLYGRDQLPFGQ